MSTQLFWSTRTPADSFRLQFAGAPYASIEEGAKGWNIYSLVLSRDNNFQAAGTRTTVAGPTNGIEIDNTTNNAAVICFVSNPVSAAVTISGSITFNAWASEGSMTANASINVRLMKFAPDGTVTEVHKTTRTTELGTSSSAQNWSETPTSFTLNKGDRLAVIPFADDTSGGGGGNMGAGNSVSLLASGSAGADGDDFITLTENLSFLTTDPAGTTIYPATTALPSINAGAYEAWTGRGAGATTAITNTQTGPISPVLSLQCTKTAGGSLIEWYTRPLQAFTLSGAVLVNMRVQQTLGSRARFVVEIARTNGDGTSATVWGRNGSIVSLPTSEAASQYGYVTGDDLSISDGQRLRIRFYETDAIDFTITPAYMVSGGTTTLYYAGTSGGASGDTYLTFSQTLTEFVTVATTPTILINAPSRATQRSYSW